MKASKAAADFVAGMQNQLLALSMTARLKTRSGAGTAASEGWLAGEISAAWVLALSLALTIVTMALVSVQTNQPLILTVLSVLAACGLFFVLAVAAGRVQVTSRVVAGGQEAIAAAWPEPVLITSRLGTTVYSNPAFDRMAGRGSLGLAALEGWFVGEPYASEALFRLVRAAERGETSSEDVDLKGDAMRRIEPRGLRIKVCPLELGGPGTGSLVLWRFVDITAERQTLFDRAGALERRLSAYESAPVGLFVVPPGGDAGFINATLAQWLGRSPGGLDADPVTLEAVFSRPGAEVLKRQIERAGNEAFECPLEAIAASGRSFPVRVVAGAALAEEPRGLSVARILAVMRAASADPLSRSTDVSDLSFARHFQSAPFGIATVTASGLIASANGAFAHMVLDATGGIDEAAIDVLCRETPPETRAAVQHGLAEALSGQGSVTPVDFTAGSKGEFGRRVYMTPLAPSPGGREALILYVIDTTEQRALEAKFAQSQKMDAVGKLAGGIAHDFNNVLTAIIGSADLMLQTHRASDAAHKDIQNIKQSANRAAGLVGKLMAFSRQQPMQLEVLQLGDAMTDLRPMLKTSLGEKIELKIATGRDLWYVKADRTQIDQVVVNLAVNAQHAMMGGGVFSVRTRNITEREAQKAPHPGLPIAEYVLIEAEDTGTGMPPEVLAKIFEPFFTTKDVGKGTGLGLATVYGIVKQSAGFIFADSVPGQGTVFRLYLPRAHVENEAEFVAQKAVKKDRQPAALSGSATVLIVEDEDMVRSVAVRSLTRLGYRVLEAGNGYEALDIVAEQKGAVDIVISDVVMPEMDGPAFLKEVRKTHPGLKIIFVSGHTNEAFKASVDDNEEFAFLPKPFSLPQLAAKVKDELAR